MAIPREKETITADDLIALEQKFWGESQKDFNKAVRDWFQYTTLHQMGMISFDQSAMDLMRERTGKLGKLF